MSLFTLKNEREQVYIYLEKITSHADTSTNKTNYFKINVK